MAVLSGTRSSGVDVIPIDVHLLDTTPFDSDVFGGHWNRSGYIEDHMTTDNLPGGIERLIEEKLDSGVEGRDDGAGVEGGGGRLLMARERSGGDEGIRWHRTSRRNRDHHL